MSIAQKYDGVRTKLSRPGRQRFFVIFFVVFLIVVVVVVVQPTNLGPDTSHLYGKGRW